MKRKKREEEVGIADATEECASMAVDTAKSNKEQN